MSEMNGKFANEAMYKRLKKRLIIIGSILLALGVIIMIVCIIAFASSLKDFEDPNSFPTKTMFAPFGIVAGFGFIGVGIMLLITAHKREIASFHVATVAPVTKDVSEYAADEIAPSISKGVSKIAKDLKETKEEIKYCSECGEACKKNAKFCSKCGSKFEE